MFGRRHHHRHADFENRDHYHGRRHRNDPDHIARVKLDIPKFTWKESADEYLNWVEQCDQIFRVPNFLDQHRVNLASVEFSGYALTWWTQLQEHQLRMGLRHINTWEEMKRVMKRRFVPSSYQHDLQNRLQLLKQGKKSVDEYFKEMELLLVQTGIREDPESTMARFLGGLNEEISGFVEMFPYRTLQDLVDQAMRTKRKIQQESRGKSYASHYNDVPCRKQQSSASFGGGRSQGNAARSSPSNGTPKVAASIGPFPANKQQPATSTLDPIGASVATSSTRTREIVCHKSHGRGHIAAQCLSRRTMLLNKKVNGNQTVIQKMGDRSLVMKFNRKRMRFSKKKVIIIVLSLFEC
jgi:hypothetical protein